VSNHLAVATVTAALQHVLTDAVADISGAGVTTGRPAAAQPAAGGNGTSAPTGINVFLYRVSPNAALRNDDLPTRDDEGTVKRRPCAALDLHYLLTFQGNEAELVPERVLGKAVAALHARPLLTRETIEQAIQAQPSNVLDESDLGAQVERVKLTPANLSLDELSKLWSVFFQAPYSLSLAYLGSVVLVEAEVPYRPAPEVARRLLRVVPLGQPVIASVENAAPGRPIHAGSTLSIRGRSLRGDVTKVRVGDAEATVKPTRDDEIAIDLASPPFAAGSLRPGIQGVRVVHELLLGDPATPHRGATSAAAAVAVRPRVAPKQGGGHDIAVSNVATDPDGLRSAEVAVRLDMHVGERQQVTLQIDEAAPQPGAPAKGYGQRAADRTQPTDLVKFELERVLSGDYLVRVQVDGADTPLELDQDPQSPTAGQYTAPSLTIP
jgi:Pvc16 N-terminal domain